MFDPMFTEIADNEFDASVSATQRDGLGTYTYTSSVKNGKFVTKYP